MKHGSITVIALISTLLGVAVLQPIPADAAMTPLADATARLSKIERTATNDDYQRTLAVLSGLPGFLHLLPGPPRHTAVFAGPVPDGVPRATLAGVPIDVRGHAAGQTLMRPTSGQVRTFSVEEALQLVQEPQAGPQGPLLPGPQNGIGPGNALRMSFSAGTFICSASYLFEDRVSGKYYLSTAGHCLLENGAGPATNGTFAPNSVARWVEVCFANCIMNVPGVGAFLRLSPNPVTRYHPVAFAVAQGVGSDFGLIEIPRSANPLLRPWLSLWGGPLLYEQPTIDDLMVHYGHGSYCCEVVGAVATRTILDQGRVAVAPTSNGLSFSAFGHVTGGDSGSAAGTGFPDLNRRLVGRGASGVITHAIIITGAPIFSGTTLARGQTMSQGVLGFRPDLVLEGATIRVDTPPPPPPPPEPVPPPAPRVLQAAIHAPSEGQELTASGSFTVRGNASFPPGIGTPGTQTVTYFLHREGTPPNCADSKTYMDTTVTVTESGSGCASLTALGAVQGTPPLTLRFPSDPRPSQDLVLDPVRRPVAELFVSGVSNTPVLLGDFEARLAYYNGTQVVASARTSVLAIAPNGKATIEMTPLLPAIPERVDLEFVFIVHQAVSANFFVKYGVPAASNVKIPLGVPPARAVEVSVDDPTFGNASRLLVNGTTNWTALWPLDDVAPGSHTLRARAVLGGDVSPAAIVNVSVVAPESNGAPIARAGGDFTVPEQTSFFLNGTGSSDPDGDPIQYGWTQVLGPAAAIVDPTSARPQVFAPALPSGVDVMKLVFRLSVTDGQLSSMPDEVTVVVTNVNEVPVASILGPNQTRKNRDVTFDGGHSTDPDGFVASWSWDLGDGTFASGPSVTHAYRARGTFLVTLTVTDNEGAVASTTRSILVK